jgi:hypothetical protein
MGTMIPAGRETDMFCPQCGTTNDDSATSCSACGYDLGKYRQQWDGGETAATPGEAPAVPGEAASAVAPNYQAPGYQGPYRQAPYQGPPYQQQPYPRYYSAPPYQQGPYAPGQYGAAQWGMRPHVPNYLGWAIAVLILCFWPTGIPAVVFASQVDNKLAMGDIEGARESSRKAKMWTWISFWIAIAGWVLFVGVFVLIAIVSTSVGGTIY